MRPIEPDGDAAPRRREIRVAVEISIGTVC